MDKKHLIEYCEKRLNKAIDEKEKSIGRPTVSTYNWGKITAYKDILDVLKEK